MAERIVLKPPEIVEVDPSSKVVFLAGPIQGAPNWQVNASDIIHSKDSSLVVASPRKVYAPGQFVYEKQVDWETYYLNRAAKCGAIIFWLAAQSEETPGRSYAQTSRFELGEWKVRHQEADAPLVIGIEQGFGNERYIRRRIAQDCPDVPVLDNLQDTCEAVVAKLSRIIHP